MYTKIVPSLPLWIHLETLLNSEAKILPLTPDSFVFKNNILALKLWHQQINLGFY